MVTNSFKLDLYNTKLLLSTRPKIDIVNVVASADIHQKLDLYKIQEKFPYAEYNPEQFPGLVFRIRSPKTTTLLFRTGKMVCTGARSEDQAKKAVMVVVQELRKGGIKIKKNADVIIQNIVSSVNLGGRVNVEQTARSLPRSMYEPEQFPGVIHRMIDPKVVLLIFGSGKLVCAGAKSEKDVFRSVNNLHHILEEKELMFYN